MTTTTNCRPVAAAGIDWRSNNGTSEGAVQGEPGAGPLMLIFVALIAILAIGIWFSRGPNANTAGMTQNSARAEASSLQQTGAALASAYAAALMRDSFSPDLVTFDTAARTTTGVGIFNTTDGFTSQPTLQTSALSATTVGSNNVKWQRLQANIAGLGTGANHYIAVLPNLRQPVCQAINAARWNYGTSTAVPIASNASTANVTSGLASANGVGSVLLGLTVTSPAGFTDGKDEACLVTTDNTYFYYKVIAVQ